LAQCTGLPLIHLDAFYWRDGWIEPNKQDWISTVDQLLAGEAWIMDGNFGGTLERRLAACDGVIFLDVSPWICLWRVLRRRIQHHGRARPEMPAGCHERLSWEFLWWILSYPAKRRPAILRRLAELRGERSVFILRGARAIESFLQAPVSAADPS
jgi:adenylate kinase family enzyme